MLIWSQVAAVSFSKGHWTIVKLDAIIQGSSLQTDKMEHVSQNLRNMTMRISIFYHIKALWEMTDKLQDYVACIVHASFSKPNGINSQLITSSRNQKLILLCSIICWSFEICCMQWLQTGKKYFSDSCELKWDLDAVVWSEDVANDSFEIIQLIFTWLVFYWDPI